MTATVEIEDRDMGMEDLMRRIRASASHVDIGIHADEDGTLIKIAAAHEYGATIDHPGGTAYGFATAEDAAKGRVRFLKGGSGFRVLGVTRPHIIKLPMRSYIRSTVDENQERYHQIAADLVGRIVEGDLDKFSGLSIMGQQIESDIKAKITNLRTPPLKPATIRRKGSDNPLVDRGILRSSVRFVVKSEGEGALPDTEEVSA